MKNLFLTGGSSGIGYSVLQKFSAQNWNIYSTYNNNKLKIKSLKKNFSNVKFYNLNLYSNSSIDKLTNKIKSNLDGIILNASDTIFIPISDYKKLTPKLFSKYVNINLIAQYRLIYNLIPKLNNKSNIILISSIASKNGIGSNLAYSCSKAGINNLAKSLSRVLGGRVQINCIAPGLMRTNFTTKFTENYFQNYILKTPSKKLTTPDDIANIAFSICSSFNNFTGQTIFVDGGVS